MCASESDEWASRGDKSFPPEAGSYGECLCFFPLSHRKILDQNQWKGERVYSGSQFSDSICQGGRNLKELVTSHPHSGVESKVNACCFSAPFFYSHNLGNVATHSRKAPPPPYNQDNHPQACPEAPPGCHDILSSG